MKRKTSVISALAVLTAQAGLPTSALAHEARILEDSCEYIWEIVDRSLLQAELTRLLERRPDDPCITLLVTRLGGPPLAQLQGPLPPY